jgi:hypothetical protein
MFEALESVCFTWHFARRKTVVTLLRCLGFKLDTLHALWLFVSGGLVHVTVTCHAKKVSPQGHKMSCCGVQLVTAVLWGGLGVGLARDNLGGRQGAPAAAGCCLVHYWF